MLLHNRGIQSRVQVMGFLLSVCRVRQVVKVSGCVAPSPCRPKLRRPNFEVLSPNLTYSINSNDL